MVASIKREPAALKTGSEQRKSRGVSRSSPEESVAGEVTAGGSSAVEGAEHAATRRITPTANLSLIVNKDA
jgi:hypothetical protein